MPFEIRMLMRYHSTRHHIYGGVEKVYSVFFFLFQPFLRGAVLSLYAEMLLRKFGNGKLLLNIKWSVLRFYFFSFSCHTLAFFRMAALAHQFIFWKCIKYWRLINLSLRNSTVSTWKKHCKLRTDTDNNAKNKLWCLRGWEIRTDALRMAGVIVCWPCKNASVNDKVSDSANGTGNAG